MTVNILLTIHNIIFLTGKYRSCSHLTAQRLFVMMEGGGKTGLLKNPKNVNVAIYIFDKLILTGISGGGVAL